MIVISVLFHCSESAARRLCKTSHKMSTLPSRHSSFDCGTPVAAVLRNLCVKKGLCFGWQFPHILNTTETNLPKNVVLC